MKLYGSLSRLVSILFRKDSQDITLRPNQSTTYTAARDMQLPPGDADHVFVSASSTQTLTGKTIDGDDNTIQDLALSSLKTVLGDADEAIVRDASGAVVSAKIVNANIDAAAAIDASKIADGSVSNTEFQYIGGLTSDAQTQLDAKASRALDNLQVTNLAQHDLLKASSSSAVERIAVGTEGQILTVVSGTPAWADAASVVTSFKTNWANADGTSKSITHSLGSTDLLVQIHDVTTGQAIEVDTMTFTDSNTLDLTASEAPAVNWRVKILAI